ncbi:hypothetical protein RSOL_019310, partial [Rhizoctonia solani AG-3 Rhs1AP]
MPAEIAAVTIDMTGRTWCEPFPEPSGSPSVLQQSKVSSWNDGHDDALTKGKGHWARLNGRELQGNLDQTPTTAWRAESGEPG